jgi:hypothetical protein
MDLLIELFHLIPVLPRPLEFLRDRGLRLKFFRACNSSGVKGFELGIL